jgi:hypothetical protein
MTVSALLLPADAAEGLQAIELEPDGDARTHLNALYAALRVSLVDVVRLPDGIDLWLDDEGRLNGSGSNPVLTSMLVTWGYNVPRGDSLRGSGIFASTDGEGGMISLTERQREIVASAHRQALVM